MRSQQSSQWSLIKNMDKKMADFLGIFWVPIRVGFHRSTWGRFSWDYLGLIFLGLLGVDFLGAGEGRFSWDWSG